MRGTAVGATFAATLLLAPWTAFGAEGVGAERGREVRPTRPVHTYSIVARDPETGDLGVAVQSHWFSVGPLVAWAEAGVGAVATQSFVDPSYGPLGLGARPSNPRLGIDRAGLNVVSMRHG